MDGILSIAQVIGYLAFGISLLSYQTKSQRTLFGVNMGTDLLWAIHYTALGGWMPALSVMISALRTCFAVFLFPRHKIIVALTAFLCLAILCLMYNVDGIKGYLLIATGFIYSVCVIFHHSYVISRSLMALGLILWIWIGYLYGSHAEIVSSAFSLASLILASIRHTFLKKQSSKVIGNAELVELAEPAELAGRINPINT